MSYINMEVIHRPDKPRSGRGAQRKRTVGSPRYQWQYIQAQPSISKRKKQKLLLFPKSPV